MEFKLEEGKQVGRLMYMVESPTILYRIIDEGRIVSGQHNEKNPYTGTTTNDYVCFSRTNLPADRNPKRWAYGIVLDGDKLSNKYSIKPYSYKGNKPEEWLPIKVLTAYDDGTYTMYIVNFGTLAITKDIFDYVEQVILNMPDELKATKKLTVTDSGKRAINGHRIAKKYEFHVKSGGPKIKPSSQPTLNAMWNSRMDETEERVWKPEVDISDCITGVIMPAREDYTYEEQELINLADSMGLDIKYYNNKYFS